MHCNIKNVSIIVEGAIPAAIDYCINSGYSIDQISNITGASVSDIEKALASTDNAAQNK